MTAAIQVAGLCAVVAIAILMVRPAWRVPALAGAMLALPGNVDNVLPQMALDPNAIANNTAPIVSFIDLLLAWAVVLTIRDTGKDTLPRRHRAFVLASLVLLLIAAGSAAAALADGVEGGAVARGIILFARFPALLFVVFRLRAALAPRALAAATTLAVVVLLGNGLYTTLTFDLTRFTAATFGRNGFAVVLSIFGVIAAGFGFELFRRQQPRFSRLAGAGALAIAAAAVFGSFATGSRIGLLVLVPAVLLAIYFGRTLWSPRGRRETAALVGGLLVIALASALVTPGGHRTFSVISAFLPERPGDAPTEEERAVETRGDFWILAVRMAAERPVTGFGPYQWNFQRYERDPQAIVVLADPHNAFLQIGAEFGIPVLIGYLGLVLAFVGSVLVTAARSRNELVLTSATVIVAAACAFPLGDFTNSNLFNVRIGAIMWLVLPAALVFAEAASRRTDLVLSKP